MATPKTEIKNLIAILGDLAPAAIKAVVIMGTLYAMLTTGPVPKLLGAWTAREQAETAYYDAARGALPGSTITHRPDGTIVVLVKDVP